MPELDPDRWRAVTERLDEALDLPVDERPQWLAALREKDPGLAHDVAALLAEYEAVRHEHFLEGGNTLSTKARAAEAAASTRDPLAGRVLGAYRLVSLLGRGGMGVVWLGERCDGQFEARAAVKLLDTTRITSGEARFRREANFLARVTHPNIAHLLDAGVAPDGQPYLVLELVDGQPLDRYCDDRTLDLPSRIALFLHVLDAVSHAHAQRIVHRDLKPSNVLVRTDGHVKLLDFGVAKLLEHEGEVGIATTLTLEHGRALTPAYAAPEQVEGATITPATDIYALGVLLYVLLTGQHPCGELSSPAAVLKAIVDVDPRPPSAVFAGGDADEHLAAAASRRGTTPRGLSRLLRGNLDTIVATALRKIPEQRYASVAELADDLRRHLASQPIQARPDSLVRRAARFGRQHLAFVAVGTIAVGVLAAAVVFYANRYGAEPERRSVLEPQAPTPVTSEAGDERFPSLSPDVTRVAFSWMAPNASAARIAVRTLGADVMATLTDGAADDTMPVWSPDGQSLAFLRSYRDPQSITQVCVMPASGGLPRVLHTSAFSGVGLTWSAVRNALIFSTRRAQTDALRLVALDLATLEVRPLTNPPPAPLLAGPGDFLPTLAPDGRTVAFVRETYEGRDIFALELATTIERRVTRDHQRISGLTWSPDGRSLIMSSSRSGVEALYRVSLDAGTIARVPLTGDWATQPMAAGDALVFSQRHSDSNIYRASVGDGPTRAGARRIIASSRADAEPDVSPDGRSIAFVSMRAGGADVWVASADGTNPRRLTSFSAASGPRWSPDGRSIAFGGQTAGEVRPDIWVIDVSGGAPRRITADPSYETILGWSADGASVYFRSDRSGIFEVWNVPGRGGPARQVTQGGGLQAKESPDGRFLYYANDVPEVYRRALHGQPTETLMTRLPMGTHWGGHWTVGARGLYTLDVQTPDRMGIDFLPFGAGGLGRAVRIVSLTAPPADSVSVFAVAPDESWLVWAQDDYRNSDIMLLKPR
jgi:Tol biopolymer transport system component/serine/threonine protein kinase